MKFQLGFFLLWSFTVASFSASGAVTFTPVLVAENVYAFIGDTGSRTTANEGMNANSGFIVTSAGVMVIDSGTTWQVAQSIHRAIKKVTRQPVRIVVNTGGQDQRWLGNGYFKSVGAEVIAAKPALDDMRARGEMQLNSLRQVLGKKMAGTVPVHPDRFFDQSKKTATGRSGNTAAVFSWWTYTGRQRGLAAKTRCVVFWRPRLCRSHLGCFSFQQYT